MAIREIVQLRDKETGDINELRDKALKEAAKSSTPSDATNNSVIPLETENGETIKIKAESLMKAFATMINSNSKSTITTLFGALTADNNTEFGAINMSNLASVLGEEGPITISCKQFNRYPFTIRQNKNLSDCYMKFSMNEGNVYNDYELGISSYHVGDVLKHDLRIIGPNGRQSNIVTNIEGV